MSALFPTIVTFCSTRTVPPTPRAQIAPPPPGPQLSEGGSSGRSGSGDVARGRAGRWGPGGGVEGSARVSKCDGCVGVCGVCRFARDGRSGRRLVGGTLVGWVGSNLGFRVPSDRFTSLPNSHSPLLPKRTRRADYVGLSGSKQASRRPKRVKTPPPQKVALSWKSSKNLRKVFRTRSKHLETSWTKHTGGQDRAQKHTVLSSASLALNRWASALFGRLRGQTWKLPGAENASVTTFDPL